MLQLHLSDQQFYYLLRCDLYTSGLILIVLWPVWSRHRYDHKITTRIITSSILICDIRVRLTLSYSDVIMGVIASQITGVLIVCSTVCSGAEQRKDQSSASLVFVRGNHRWLVDSPHKETVRRKKFPFDETSCTFNYIPLSIVLLATYNESENVRFAFNLPRTNGSSQFHRHFLYHFSIVYVFIFFNFNLMLPKKWQSYCCHLFYNTLQFVRIMKDYKYSQKLVGIHFCATSYLICMRMYYKAYVAVNSPGTGELPAQMASNAEKVSIWWRHHDYSIKISMSTSSFEDGASYGRPCDVLLFIVQATQSSASFYGNAFIPSLRLNMTSHTLWTFLAYPCYIRCCRVHKDSCIYRHMVINVWLNMRPEEFISKFFTVRPLWIWYGSFLGKYQY